MESWKRRLVVLVMAVGTALVFLSPADAREPRDRGDAPFDFTIPSLGGTAFPPPPTMPPPTVTSLPPPPTMPPPTTSTTSPPPTMPPPTTTITSPPPTMPPFTVPPLPFDEQLIEEIIEDLEGFGEEFQDIIDFLSDPLGFLN